MNKGIRFKGFLDLYLRWPFYLFVLLVAGSIGIFCIDKQAGLASLIVDLVYLLIAWIVFYAQKKRFVEEMISFLEQKQYMIRLKLMISFLALDL